MNRDHLKQILEQVRTGELTVEQAGLLFQRIETEHLGFASVDHHRALRLGFPEVIYGEGKTPDQIVSIFQRLCARHDVVLITRIDSQKSEYLIDQTGVKMDHNPLARTILYSPEEIPIRGRGSVLVIAAGTSDLPVAEEAKVTALALGNRVNTLYDVGIAGIHRVLEHIDVINSSSVIVVVAGMEGALPSVIGGLVDRPVIAVPTSVGYGASFGGIAALLGMLNSCAPGVVVVNIDNGFGAAYAASVMNRDREL
ncbi:MAG: nickel pincer cofactor biosynthesis protein LarB [Deltaproteobacteria bacterium]|nr:nickel pincer cofactor biosynthesis protein LarB [Deltaproteobacteria bacterium]